jgi:uncharacterized protein YebE (UPF0316 family)
VSFAIDRVFAHLSILPVLVFVAETCVVTLCTVRTISIARGRKSLAATLGFFEVSIWLFAIGQIMQNLTDLSCYLAFATGFSLGNYLGVIIERKLALGNVVVQITTKKDTSDLIDSLKLGGYGVTTLDAYGATGPVEVVFTVIKRKELENVTLIIKGFDPKAFYSVNDLHTASEGISPAAKGRYLGVLPGSLLSLFSMPRLGRVASPNTPSPLRVIQGRRRIAAQPTSTRSVASPVSVTSSQCPDICSRAFSETSPYRTRSS